jgi:hypothetical protein
MAKGEGFEKVVMLPLGYIKFKWKMLDYNLDFKATLSQGFFLTCLLANFHQKKSLICNF